MTGIYFVTKLRLGIVAKTRSHYETNLSYLTSILLEIIRKPMVSW